MPQNNPKIQVECSPELLTELHDAHEALQRARARSKAAANAPALERLIVAIHAARKRAEAARPKVAPNAEPAG